MTQPWLEHSSPFTLLAHSPSHLRSWQSCACLTLSVLSRCSVSFFQYFFFTVFVCNAEAKGKKKKDWLLVRCWGSHKASTCLEV
ncbi:hypothetical protein DUNSADRAFT_3059 [Dunaliella salina]|uniref:Encoded protein n=1 Tax=Dunaliella salina TaxID=3046 RepID=A0ABQ7FVN9_DUNSA|nr:hypothetical protein DUNSADRAFT_3059 [Dunaliella salina]|eukprot:KAF5826453.1 hypothetical protein DUNSADRAFT_3059 [Dunaliella salina]